MTGWERPVTPPTAPPTPAVRPPAPTAPTARTTAPPVVPTEILGRTGTAPPPPMVAPGPHGSTAPMPPVVNVVAGFGVAFVAACIAFYFARVAIDSDYPPSFFLTLVFGAAAAASGAWSVRALYRARQSR